METHKENLTRAVNLFVRYNQEGPEAKSAQKALEYYIKLEDEMIKCRQFLGAEPNETLFELISIMIKNLPRLNY